MRNTAVVSVSVSDFKIITKIDKYSVGLFEAAWMKGTKFAFTRQSISQALISKDFDLAFLYQISVKGGDDAEKYVVDDLFLNNLPAIVIFSRGGVLEHKSEVSRDGKFDIGSFVADFIRVVSSNSSISPNITANESQDKHTYGSQQSSHSNIVSLIFHNSIKSTTEVINGIECSKNCNQDLKTSIKNSTTTAPIVTDQIDLGAPKALKLFISGDKSSVGKSSICLALLGSLIRLGVKPSCIAYIKPVTQCEADQPVTEYCLKSGISHRGVGPVVFFKGFTRAYLNGETDSAEILTQAAVDAVNQISVGKRIVIIDGVGYPSVGSICNLSNADIARAIGCPVLLVGKSGVGDAVDSYNLNARFFESYGVTVLGGIFNKLSLEGFYQLSACKKAVTAYFLQHRPGHFPYGFMPILPVRKNNEDGKEVESISAVPFKSDLLSTGEMSLPPVPSVTSPSDDALVDAFLHHVDLGELLLDIFKYSVSTLINRIYSLKKYYSLSTKVTTT